MRRVLLVAISCAIVIGVSPVPGSAQETAPPIEHLVVILEQNSTFDHTLGTLQGVDGVVVGQEVPMAGGRTDPWTVAVWAIALATVLALFVTMRRYFILGRANPWYLLFYPLAVLFVLGFQVRALMRALGLGSVTWRGTTYKGDKVVAGRGR